MSAPIQPLTWPSFGGTAQKYGLVAAMQVLHAAGVSGDVAASIIQEAGYDRQDVELAMITWEESL